MPGIAASTKLTCALGSAPNSADAPENNFAFDVTCACTSMPMTTSHLPVTPSSKGPVSVREVTKAVFMVQFLRLGRGLYRRAPTAQSAAAPPFDPQLKHSNPLDAFARQFPAALSVWNPFEMRLVSVCRPRPPREPAPPCDTHQMQIYSVPSRHHIRRISATSAITDPSHAITCHHKRCGGEAVGTAPQTVAREGCNSPIPICSLQVAAAVPLRSANGQPSAKGSHPKR